MKPKTRFSQNLLTFLMCSIVLTACSSSGGGGSKTKTATLSAGAGGTISLGDLSLTIPPGALAEDTEITIRKIDPGELPDEFSDLDADSAYELLPDGLQFLMPVTATLKIDDKPVQEDGSLVSGLPPLLITSQDGELEVLEDLTMHVNGDANRMEATGLLGHFSHVMIKHPVRIDTGENLTVDVITVTISGVPDSHPVGLNSPFTAIVQTDNNAEIEPKLTAEYSSFPSSPIANNHETPLPRFGLPRSYPYVCTEPGTGTYRSTVSFEEAFVDFASLIFLIYNIPDEVLSTLLHPALLQVSFEKNVECTDPEGGNGGGEETTFPNIQFSAEGTFTFLNADCPLIFPDFIDDSYLFTTLGGDITIFQGNTLDIANGLIDLNGNFSAQQIEDGVVIENYTNGKCTTSEPFSCTANYMYLATDPDTQQPCPAFYNASFALDPIQTF